MGIIEKAICNKCGYESREMCLSGGMMAQWIVSERYPYVCHNCNDVKGIVVYRPPDEIEKCIEEIETNKECNYSGLTEDRRQAVSEIKDVLVESRKQQANGIKCPDCGSADVEVLDTQKPMTCPKCKKGTLELTGCGLWD